MRFSSAALAPSPVDGRKWSGPGRWGVIHVCGLVVMQEPAPRQLMALGEIPFENGQPAVVVALETGPLHLTEGPQSRADAAEQSRLIRGVD